MSIPSIALQLDQGSYIHFNIEQQSIHVTQGRSLLLPLQWTTRNDCYTCLLISNEDSCFQIAALMVAISGHLIGTGEKTMYGIRYPVLPPNA